MKRIIGAWLGVTVTAMSVLPAFALEWTEPDSGIAGTEVKELINYDFESYDEDLLNGTLPERLSLIDNKGHISSHDFGGEHGTVIDIGYTAATGGGDPLLQIACDTDAKVIQVEADFYDPTWNSRLEMGGRGATTADGITVASYRAQSNGVVYTPDFSTGYFDGCTGGQWHNVKYVLDLETKEFSMWLDGSTFVENGIVNSWGDLSLGLTFIRFFVMPYANTYPGSIYLDNIKAYEIYEYPAALGITSVKDGAESEEMFYDADAFKISLSGEADADTVNADTVILSDGYTVIPCTVEYFGGNEPYILITPKDELKSNSKYTVTLTTAIANAAGSHAGEDKILEFTTTAKAFDVISASFEVSGNKISFKPVVANNTQEEKRAVSIVTVWNGSRFVEAKAAEQLIEPGGASEIDTPEAVYAEGNTVFGFVWDGFADAVSVTGTNYSYPEGSVHGYTGGTVTVAGEYKAAGAPVTALIAPSSQSVSLLTAEMVNGGGIVPLTLFTGEDGSYSSSVTFGGDFPEGSYTLYTTEDGNALEPLVFDYIKKRAAVRITAPTEGTYSGSDLNKIEYITENFGNGIDRVELYVDGALALTGADESGQFPLELTSGSHELEIRAYGADGEEASDSVNVAVAGSNTSILIDSDFNDYTSGNPNGLECGSIAANGGYIKPVFIDEEHGQSIELGAEGATTSAMPFFGIATGNTNDIVVCEAEIYFPAENTGKLTLTIRNRDSSDSLTLADFRPYNQNEIYIPGTGGTASGGLNCFELGRWYKIRYVIDGSTNIYSLWLDDICYAEDRLADNTGRVTVLNQLRFFMGSPGADGGSIIADNIKAYIITNYPYVTGFGSVKNGEELDSVEYDADKIAVRLSGAVNADSLDGNITLMWRNHEIETKDISLSDDMKTIWFSSGVPLNSNTEYTLKLGRNLKTSGGLSIGYDQTAFFTTSMRTLDVTGASFRENGSSVAFVPVVKNDAASGAAVSSVINIWNGNELVSSAAVSTELAANSTQSMQTPWLQQPDGSYAEGCVFGVPGDGILVGDRIFENGGAPQTDAGGTAGYNPQNGTLTVREQTGRIYAPVGIMVVPFGSDRVTPEMIGSGKAVFTEAYTDADGVCARSIGLSTFLEGGKYTMYIFSNGTLSEGYTFMHINMHRAGEIISKINAASSAAELGALLNENKETLGIDPDEYNKAAAYINELVFGNRPSGGYTAATLYSEAYCAITSYYIKNTNDFKAALKQYASIIGIDYENEVEALGSNVWKAVGEYLKKRDYTKTTIAEALRNGTILGKISCVSRYTELEKIIIPEAGRLGINTGRYNNVSVKDNVWKYFFNNRSGISDIDDIVNIFDSAVKNAESTANNNSSSGGGGGYGGGSSGGGGFSFDGSLVTNVNGIENIVSDGGGSAGFTDMGGHWAKDTVERMYGLGIISGFDDGSFGPELKITRAQYCKMIVMALKLSCDGTTVSYSDVPESEWYFEYVRIASEKGIVNGFDGMFRPDDNITRQDAAVMLYRGIRSVGRNVFGSMNFKDSAEIADYAADAVSCLGASGIINGSDGSFYPGNNATRAEAATLIMNMINYIGG